MRRIPLLVIALAAVLALATAPPAGAAPKKLTTRLGNIVDTGNNPIAFTGDRVVFLNRPQFQNFGSIESVSLSGKRRKLVTIKPGGKERNVSIRFDAAPGRLVYGMHEYEDPADAPPGNSLFHEIRTGPLDGPYAKVDGCDTNPAVTVRDVRASTNAIVYTGNGCDKDPTMLRGFSNGGYVRQLDPDSGVTFRLIVSMAGNLVLFGDVMDHVSNSVLYTPQGRGLTPALQEDGTLVTIDEGPLQPSKLCGQAIEVFNAAQPAGQTLPVRGCGGDIAVAGGRIAAMRQAGSGVEVISMNLSGGEVRVHGRAPTANSVRGIDTDGKRVVWHVLGCYEDVLWSSAAGDATVPAGPTSCPLKLRSKTIPVRKGAAQIPVTCSRGCALVRGLLSFSSSDRAFNATATHQKPGRSILRVKLSKAQLARVRDGKANQVPLRINWIDVLGRNPSTSATVKLVEE
jgi:hypothetical protein